MSGITVYDCVAYMWTPGSVVVAIVITNGDPVRINPIITQSTLNYLFVESVLHKKVALSYQVQICSYFHKGFAFFF